MVLPAEELYVNIEHIRLCRGSMVGKVETYEDRNANVLEGTAEVTQSPLPVPHFQCLHRPVLSGAWYGDGTLQQRSRRLGCFRHSPARRLRGFSVIEILKDNPKEKTIHFRGIQGHAIRSRYLGMTYDIMDKDGVVRTIPFFGDIALVVREKAAFEDMRSKDFTQNNAAFAGHSLGEHSALASVVGVLPISSLVDVVFYRDITMQRAVERDSKTAPTMPCML